MNRLKELIRNSEHAEAWRRMRRLTADCRDYPALLALCRWKNKLQEEAGPPAGAVPLRIALLSGATVDLIVEPFRLMLTTLGFSPDLHVGGYGQFVQELIDPSSSVHSFDPQVVVVVNTPFNISEWPDMDSDLVTVTSLADQACERLLGPCGAAHHRIGCDVIVNNLHPLPLRPLSNFGAKQFGDPTSFIRRFNLALAERAPDYVHINDVAAMVERHGLSFWFDQRYWFHAKQPIAFGAVAEYARNTAAIVGAMMGKSRKCLVVDLDNTLWGGVVGDDGVDGIELGEGTAAGEAYKAFQLYLRTLRDRGVLLAVCSKNDERTAKEAFTNHPEMALTLEDFVAFKANWLPKSDNLQAMARELDLGLDAFVLVDDNPAEREQVRQALPQVAVPELTDEPADYAQIIEAGRYFETVSMTGEDRERTATYMRRQAAVQAATSATDLTSFLKSLNMKAIVSPFDNASMNRITQLTNKTNQFNLTTRRVTLSEMESISTDPSYITRTVRLADCFGDHGLISVLMGKVVGTVITLENWLMSCRVLKRGVERALFNSILEEARRRGATDIVGIYKPTDRNSLVKHHYDDLGFSKISESDHETCWKLTVSEAIPMDHFIGIEQTTDKRSDPS